jgi:hypothetical protein
MKLLTSSLLLVVGLSLAAPVASAVAFPASITIARGDYATLISQTPRSPINIRDDASTRAYARHIGYAGDRVEVLDRTSASDGYMWFFVRFTVSNATGWVRGDFVALDGE